MIYEINPQCEWLELHHSYFLQSPAKRDFRRATLNPSHPKDITCQRGFMLADFDTYGHLPTVNGYNML